MVPEWLGPVVRISLGWFGREVSHVGESVQGQRLLTAVRLALLVTLTLTLTLIPFLTLQNKDNLYITCSNISINFIIFNNPYKHHFTRKCT